MHCFVRVMVRVVPRGSIPGSPFSHPAAARGAASPGHLQRGWSAVLERPAHCPWAPRGTSAFFLGQPSRALLRSVFPSSALTCPAVHFWGLWVDAFSESQEALRGRVSRRCFLPLSSFLLDLQKARGSPLCHCVSLCPPPSIRSPSSRLSGPVFCSDLLATLLFPFSVVGSLIR